METLTDKKIAKIKARHERASVEPEKKTQKPSKKSTKKSNTKNEEV